MNYCLEVCDAGTEIELVESIAVLFELPPVLMSPQDYAATLTNQLTKFDAMISPSTVATH